MILSVNLLILTTEGMELHGGKIHIKNSVKLCTLRGFLLLFILSSFSVNSCAGPQIQSDFYQGLLSKSEKQNSAEAARHFEKALNSSNVYIRRAAAEELANLMYEGAKLSFKTAEQVRTERVRAERVRREAAGSWAGAFDAVGKLADREKALAFLLGMEQATAYNEARLYTLNECEKQGVFFSDTEMAAIDGHFAVSRSRYNEALIFFRKFMEDGEWPAQIPALFIQYPDLINDLGRAFQYTSSGNEGLDLFLQWEKNLADNAPETGGLQFSLLFYAARISHRRGRLDQGISLFEQALPLAPDAQQSDACIWYILDSSLSRPSGVFLQRLEQLIPYLHEDSYLTDVLEKFLQGLTANREWEKIIRGFSLIKNRNAAVSKAGYAWVIARAIEEGYLNGEEMRLAAEAASVTAATPAVFLRIAYNAGDTSFYYRLRSASALGEPFLELSLETAAAPKTSGKPSPALQFLLDFFNYGAADLSPQYIRSLEKELSADELRSVAQALAQAGMYHQSIRLVSQYVNREGYTRTRQDMEMLFPCPYRELIERYAAENSIAPSLLYGLIRTESAFQSGVISRAGAVGLTQLMPATARETADRIRRAGGPNYTSESDDPDLSDPAVNIHIGSYYFNYLMGRFDDTLLSLLAYNGGMNRVRRWRAASTMPIDLFLETVNLTETRDYGRRVIAAAAVYEELYYRQDQE